MDTSRANQNHIVYSTRNFTLSSFTKSFINSSALSFSDLLSAGIMLWLLTNVAGDETAGNQAASLIFIVLSGVAVLLFFSRGHYHKRIPFWDECKDTIKVLFGIGLFQGTLGIFLSPDSLSSLHIFAWLVNICLFLTGRTLTKIVLMRFGTWQLQTVIIGDGNNAIETAKAVTEERLLGYEVIMFFSTNEGAGKYDIEVNGSTIPVKRMGNHPEKFLRRLNSPHIIVALEKGGLNEIQHYFDRLSLRYSQISVVPALRGLPLFGTDYYHFFSHEVLMLNLRNNLSNATSRIVKRAFDTVLASILLVLFSPIFLIIALGVRKTGKQVFFGHERIGRGGKPFKCYKFRSMVPNAQEVLEDLLSKCPESRAEWAKDFKLRNDPRVTKLGHLLRKTSLDELPQLWNVMKGEMSLVGPRPVIQEEVERYGDKAVFYYKAKPGITGLWQVSGRNDIDYEDRIDLDVWYVRNWSLWNDIIILLRTVTVVIKRDGAY